MWAPVQRLLVLHPCTDSIDSPEEARRELVEIGAEYDRIQTVLDKIKESWTSPYWTASELEL